MPYPPRSGGRFVSRGPISRIWSLAAGAIPLRKGEGASRATVAHEKRARGPTQRGVRGGVLYQWAPHKIGIKLTRAQLCAAPATPHPRPLPLNFRLACARVLPYGKI